MNAAEIKSLIGKRPIQVAQEMHRGQRYGEGGVFENHLIPVAKIANRIARSLGCSKEDTTHVRDLSWLHDAPEDTGLTGEIITFLFDKRLGDDSEALNKYHGDGNKKTLDEYYRDISKNIDAKIVKTADRYMNIFTLPNTQREKAIRMYKRYRDEYEYYKKYNIFPEIIWKVLEDTRIILERDGYKK
ncbi:hypothetical protein CSB09_00640 [Candidatus Gracilibacteria bacterium]|nr:MAG: hypothetical protein CSB09_00640 [Candidatus Gracilibacteria bacterium]